MSECQTRILVVDDDPDLRDLLTSYLAREGFAVSGAEDGRAMDVRRRMQFPEIFPEEKIVVPLIRQLSWSNF